VSATPQPQLPFTKLGDYEVLAPISEGGMASVWLGRSEERLVALKVIRPEHVRNKEFVAMFLDEARIASRLSHPNIVSIFGLGHDGRRHFLAMEVLRGRTLLDLWSAAGARHQRLPVDVVAWIGARIADALHHAHELRDESGASQQVVHRDVNPANVFITIDGVPKLIDFGLARARDRISSTAVGVVKGKLAYLSPEQTRGQAADRRTDVFALGVTLWELTTNRRLFREDSDVETVRRVREASVPDPRTVHDGYPDALAEVLLRALTREPAERWQTAAELRDALDAYVRATGRPIGEEAARSLLAELSTDHRVAAWEKLVEAAGTGNERLRVWDDERQKMTWMQASIETAAPAPHREDALPAQSEPRTRRERLDRALEERLARVADGDDAAARARLHLERALVDELLGDGARAMQHAEASLAASATGVAHETLRRLKQGRLGARDLVAHVDAEIALAASESARAALLAERARLLQAAGEPSAVVRAAWERALAASPAAPAALGGLDAVLSLDDGAREAHARHLAALAEAYAAEPRLAAWLHVERAQLLDRETSGSAAAKAALMQAIAIDPGLGAVRSACVEHAVRHRDLAWLVALLDEEARLEAPARAVRLELDAACVARYALRDEGTASALLERAASRPTEEAAVRRRVLDELVALHERAGHAADALRARAMRLSLVTDPGEVAFELRSIATLYESLGDVPAAIAALDDALKRTPEDDATAEALDRLLEASGATTRRVDLWSRMAAATDHAERAARLVRAADLAERAGDVARATEALRAALVASPADTSAVDGLLRLLAEPAARDGHAQARARLAVHAHAAGHAADPARRIAHLEAIALLQEERLGDDVGAIETYEAVLRLEPARPGALVGLARVAARAGQGDKAGQALLTASGGTTDAVEADELRVRAARALAPSDPDRALSIAQEILVRRPAHGAARLLAQRLHEKAGRWGQVDAMLVARIEHSADARARASLWLAAAELRRDRLRDPAGALDAARAALAAEPSHPAARAAVVALLEASGEARALRDGLLALASSESDASARLRWTMRAAEIDELSLEDDSHALALYERSLAEAPHDAWIAERRARLLARAPEPLARTFADDASVGVQARTAAFADEASPSALRTLEREARRSGALDRVAESLTRQAAMLHASAPKLAALWGLAALQGSLTGGDEPAVLDAILALSPDDRAALGAAIRASLPTARAGDEQARGRLVRALRARLGQAADDTQRLWDSLGIALLLEPETPARTDEASEALARYREALRIDGGSVLAAHAAAQLGGALGDAEAMVAGTLALARLQSVPSQKAVLLVRAAARLANTDDARLGTPAERRARAAEVLESALDADPDAIPAVALLVAVREEQGARDRLLAALRSAFDRARSMDAVTQLGAEVARLASLVDPPDRVLAAEALRRVLSLRPGHGPTLRALADQHVAQGAWGDAVDALEALGAAATEPAVRLRALFELADVHAHRLGRPADEERALLAALDVDPANVVVLRRLVEARRSRGAAAEAVAPMLERLAEAHGGAADKAASLDELAELRAAAGDGAAAERARVEAHAQAPSPQRLSRLLALDEPASEQARVLSLAVERARALDRPDAATLTRLGRLEVGSLGRHGDGVQHLRLALALAPGSHEARAALATGLLHAGSPGESIVLLAPMLAPDPTPLLSLDDVPATLATLEAGLAAEGRPDEALVARELRAIAGGLDDGAHAELRSRRLGIDPAAPVPIALDAGTLRAAVVPHDAPALLLDVAAALAGVEMKLVDPDPDASPRERRTAPPEPLRLVVHRLATLLGLPWPEIVVTDRGVRPRMGGRDGLSLLVPEVMLGRPEPVQAAMLTAPLVRVALGVPWLEDLRGAGARAVLLAAVRVVVPGHGDGGDDEIARRVTRAIGRKQKKVLAELAPALAAAPAPSAELVAQLERAVARAQLRAAFVATGDLLATLDAARAADEELERGTSTVGPAALAAVLTHPLAGDLARFALAPTTGGLRWRAQSLWSRRT
jgi:serine/threonine protein kinase